LAPCCDPKPGKNIIAYQSRGLSATVHEADCEELAKLEPERFLEACYIIEQHFDIVAYDRKNLAKDYITAISDLGLHILKFSSQYETKDGKRIVTVTFSVETNCEGEISDLTKKLQKIQGVFAVKRLKK